MTDKPNYMYGDFSQFQDDETLEEIKNDARFLQCLYEAGVDSWEGYELAVSIYRAFK